MVKSNGVGIQVYMANEDDDSDFGPVAMTFSTVVGANLTIGTSNDDKTGMDALTPHTICQTAIHKLPEGFEAATFFTDNPRKHRDIAAEVSFTQTSIDDGLAEFIGEYQSHCRRRSDK